MFDKPYKFKTRGVHPDTSSFPTFIRCHIYIFNTEKGSYVVRAEELLPNVFAIKFYPKRFKKAKDKYGKFTKFGNANQILATCLEIMKHLIEKFPSASFGFKGASSEGEDEANTKRFRLYRRIFKEKFSPASFQHIEREDQSIYLIINRNAQLIKPDLISELEAHLIASFHFEGKTENP